MATIGCARACPPPTTSSRGCNTAPNLAAYVRSAPNLNPIYGQLRQAAVAELKLPGGGKSALFHAEHGPRPLRPAVEEVCHRRHALGANVDVRKRPAGRFDEAGRRHGRISHAIDRQRDLLHDVQSLLARSRSSRQEGGRAQRAQELNLPQDQGLRGRGRMERHGRPSFRPAKSTGRAPRPARSMSKCARSQAATIRWAG